jgi:phosphoglycerate dehydrogenase-like enzyme
MKKTTLVFYTKPTDNAREFFQWMSQRLPQEVNLVMVDNTRPLETQAAACREAQMILPFRGRLTMDLIKRCPNLKLIQVTSAGTDHFDKPALAEMGIRVANNGGGNAVAVSEHTVMLIVMAYRKGGLQIMDTQSGRWDERIRGADIHQFHELTDKVVGIVGLGRIGQEVAKRLQGWNCKLIYTDIRKFPKELEQQLRVERVEFDTLISTADIITLHVPLTAQTRAMISRREFTMMKPTAILVNACRGPVVDEKALYDALSSHRILGAAIDVTEMEPTPVNNPLLKLENVTVTPHVAGLSLESRYKSLSLALENASRLANGQEPKSLVAIDE